MATVNAVGNGLSGASGSGSFAGTDSPSFITPDLGIPSAIDLTNSTNIPLAEISGAVIPYTPTITFFVPGDLSVVYTAQQGTYFQIGNMVFVQIYIEFTPTYTTAGSGFFISLPSTVATNGSYGGSFYNAGPNASNFMFPVGCTRLDPFAVPSSNLMAVNTSGSLFAQSSLQASDIPSGVAQSFSAFVVYFV